MAKTSKTKTVKKGIKMSKILAKLASQPSKKPIWKTNDKNIQNA